MAITTLLGKQKINIFQNFLLKTLLSNLDSKPSTSTPKSPSKSSCKKCFKCLGYGYIAANCPTKCTMMVKGDQVVSEHSDNSSRSNSPSPSKTLSDHECEIPCEGDLLMIRRMLGTIPKSLDGTQRENIFQTCCLINNKLCSLIIDGGSCTNVASTRVVEKLDLHIISHTKPYKLHWLNAECEIMVDKQVLINFAIGKYKDEVLCDVVPIEATHVLLGRPWQYDRHVLHDGLSNIMSFSFQGRKVTLKPLSPQGFHEDQIKIKIKRENEKANEVHDKTSHNTFSTKSILLTRATPTRYSSSLSFSLSKIPTSTPYWINNVKDDFFIPPIFPNKIIPKQSFPTWFVYRTSFSELPTFQSAKSSLPISSCIHLSNCKLTLFYVGVLNSCRNTL